MLTQTVKRFKLRKGHAIYIQYWIRNVASAREWGFTAQIVRCYWGFAHLGGDIGCGCHWLVVVVREHFWNHRYVLACCAKVTSRNIGRDALATSWRCLRWRGYRFWWLNRTGLASQPTGYTRHISSCRTHLGANTQNTRLSDKP